MTVPLRPAAPGRTPLGWTSWQAIALLGFALVAPAALPAGGGERRLPELRRRASDVEPLVSPDGCRLRCAPRHQAPPLAELPSGVPLRVLRRWLGPGGHPWLQVEVPAGAGRPSRGWLAG